MTEKPTYHDLEERIAALEKAALEARQLQTALQESEEKFRALVDSTPIAMLLYQDDRYIYANRAATTISGYSIEELGEMTAWDLVHPDHRQMIKDRVQRRQLGDATTTRYELKVATKNGEEKWVELSGASTMIGGRAAGIISVIDITERKRAEEALKESEASYRQLFDNAPAAIYRVDFKSRKFIRANDVFYEYSGYSREELSALSPLDILTPESQNLFLERLGKMAQGIPVPETVEYKIVGKAGRKWWVLLRNRNIYDAEGHVIASDVVAHDITDRKRTEEEKRNLVERLNRAGKMEALGQLAGGVAHDLNNVLGILTGYSELLLMEIPKGQRARGHVEKILHSTEKGAAIIQDLLTLARRGVTVADVVNLNDIVTVFLKTPIFEKIKAHHPRVTFRTECDRSLLNIKGSTVHLEKTLMNLVSNAAESIAGAGEVFIRTQSRYLDKAVRGYDEVKEGDYAVLTVSDTGMGIAVENREKIFEPFYTKKTMGRSGTGLGLAIVWGTVKDHNGYIDVKSNLGEGTTFTLYFPVTREELIAPQQKEPIERYMGNGESVLVVDDIAEQRDIASRLLTQLGYKVQAFSSGEEAVEYLKHHKADILVLDMIMAPGIDGLETYVRVLEIHPKQKAILVSGFSETDRVREAQRRGAGAYVKKPYLTGKIGLAIRDELRR